MIDDEDDIREGLCGILRDEGFDAVGARDGEEGVARALELAPALIVCDVNMPGLDGRGVLDRVRAHAATAHTPFIFLSVMGSAKDIRWGMNLGADDYLAKPVSSDDLLTAVYARLRRQGQHPSQPAAPHHEQPPAARFEIGPGAILAGRYRVEAHAGRGGMGTVFRARDLVEGDDVAVKLVPAGGRFGSRSQRECEILARLQHPRVVRFRDQGLASSERRFLVMDWLPGVDLAARIRERRLTVAESLRVFHHAAEALAAVHAAGVVHRDVKPSNLLLVDDDIEKATLIDFGIARANDADPITFAGEFLGTPGFVAPEQVGASPMDTGPRSDVFGLACTVWACLTGVSPFAGPNPLASLFVLREGQTLSVRQACPEVPEAVDALLATMLDRDPDHRLRDGAAVLLALRAIYHLPSAPGRG